MHEVADEHTLARIFFGHPFIVVPDVVSSLSRERPLVLRLELVVELLDDPLSDLLGDRLDVEARSHPLEQAHDQIEVLHVGAHRAGDAWVLDLDGALAAVVQRRFVDLSDRRRRDRLLIE